MGSFSGLHLIVLLVVVILIFGTKKLANMGSDIGKAVKGFKDGVKGEEDKPAAAPPVQPQSQFQAPPSQFQSQFPDKGTIDVETKEKPRF